MTDAAGRMRIDLWLFRIRAYKTRGAAAEAVALHGVRIERDGQVRRSEKASTEIGVGDRVSLAGPAGRRLLQVVALPERRGPATEARACYEVVEPEGSAGERDGLT
jgi:ribosome-associated heat shock protein Hsp15